MRNLVTRGLGQAAKEKDSSSLQIFTNVYKCISLKLRLIVKLVEILYIRIEIPLHYFFSFIKIIPFVPILLRLLFLVSVY